MTELEKLPSGQIVINSFEQAATAIAAVTAVHGEEDIVLDPGNQFHSMPENYLGDTVFADFEHKEKVVLDPYVSEKVTDSLEKIIDEEVTTTKSGEEIDASIKKAAEIMLGKISVEDVTAKKIATAPKRYDFSDANTVKAVIKQPVPSEFVANLQLSERIGSADAIPISSLSNAITAARAVESVYGEDHPMVSHDKPGSVSLRPALAGVSTIYRGESAETIYSALQQVAERYEHADTEYKAVTELDVTAMPPKSSETAVEKYARQKYESDSSVYNQMAAVLVRKLAFDPQKAEHQHSDDAHKALSLAA